MHLKTIVLTASIGLLMAGCATITPEERRAADEKTCMSYGFRKGTDALATCLQRIELDRHAETRALRYGAIDSWDRPYFRHYGRV